MRRIIVFFSWQSDTPNNHSKIKKGLEKACKKLSTELGVEVVYDESTRGEAGSPRIEGVVESKINNCDVFVADATPVTAHHEKLIPNSNVMYELGVARGVHDCHKIVIIAAKGDWETTKLPFDINHAKIIPIDIEDVDSFYHLIKDSVKFAIDNPETVFSQDDNRLYSDSQIKKNINSGKYLPDTFLDNRALKEHLRYFSDPFLFSEYVANKIYCFNFQRLNRGRKIWNKPKFKFNATKFKIESNSPNFSMLYESVNKLLGYVKGKTDELHNLSNEGYLNSSKCRRRAEDLSFLSSKICLLTANAGQGKTNFICDFVQNVLIKRHIPFAYVNGYEIDSSDIEKTFVKAICPTLDISFQNMMSQLNLYCASKRKPIIFIIDGLNENPHPEEFCRMLVGFIKQFLAYDFCKLIMTCRNEYLDENFKELTSTFEKEMLVERNLHGHISDEEKEELLSNYFKYFRIKAYLSDGVRKSLTSNLLLLRIFCEANKGKNLGNVGHIKRDELFTEYYHTMLARVANAPDWEGRKFFREKKIKDFFMNILKRMVESDTFFNVPLDELLSDMEQEDENMLLRFLDENILLRKDLSNGDSAEGNKEVVNFTYDAFRDYLLAHYILDAMSGKTASQKELICRFTSDGHQLKEGIIPYIFVHAKNKDNEELLNLLKEQPWYVTAFESYIWEVDETNITDEDIELVKNRLTENPKKIAKRLLFWGRWYTEDHPRLNIKILLEYVGQLDDDGLAKWVDTLFGDNGRKEFLGYKRDSERENYVEINRELLDDHKFFEQKDAQLIFEFYAYVASVSNESAKNVYVRYVKQSGNVEQVLRVAHSTKSEKLRCWMNQIIAGD